MLRARRQPRGMAEVVTDASALVDLLLGTALGDTVRRRLSGHVLHAPAHVDAEVLSALGRMQRAGQLNESDVETRLALLVSAPLMRHPVADLLMGAWSRRQRLRLADALYIELASSNGWPLVTTDRRLRNLPAVDVVEA